jgi:hypothetical protein
VSEFADWVANDFLPWVAYQALKAGRLVALDKCPGIHPIGIVENWSHLTAKCALFVAGGKAKEECGMDQLCAGLKAGIKRGIHTMHLLWDTHSAEEEWGFLLMDAKNAFNKGDQIAMCWTIRHLWPSGARFTFNCYRHWSTLMIPSANGTALFVHSQEGVMQGDPISMVAYGILLLPLIRTLKDEIPEVDQPWYADNAGAGGTFKGRWQYFEKLQEKGPRQGYFPEPSKSILIVQEHNKEAAEEYFKDFGFFVITGSRYHGGFIGEAPNQLSWIQEKTEDWVAFMRERGY